jgi:hypothetical protein
MRSTYHALESLVGPALWEVRPAIGQEPRFRGPSEGRFYTGLHYSLAANGLTWQDGGELKGWKTDDPRLSECKQCAGELAQGMAGQRLQVPVGAH